MSLFDLVAWLDVLFLNNGVVPRAIDSHTARREATPEGRAEMLRNNALRSALDRRSEAEQRIRRLSQQKKDVKSRAAKATQSLREQADAGVVPSFEFRERAEGVTLKTRSDLQALDVLIAGDERVREDAQKDVDHLQDAPISEFRDAAQKSLALESPRFESSEESDRSGCRSCALWFAIFLALMGIMVLGMGCVLNGFLHQGGAFG